MISCAQEQNSSSEFQWRGPNRDGIYPEKNLLDTWPEEGPELIWEFNDLGAGYSSVAIDGDNVITAGTTDSINYIYTFNKRGDLLWKKELGRAWTDTYPGIRSTPLIKDGKAYVFDGLGVMHCFNTQDGKVIWQRDLLSEYNVKNNQHGVHENLIIDGNKLFCTLGGETTNIITIDKDTGETIWESKGLGELNAYCSTNIITHNGVKYYITMTYNALLSFEVETGKMAWSEELTERKYGIHANVPYYRDGKLFVIEGWKYGARMYNIAEDGQSVELLWEFKNVDPQMGDAIVIDDNIYIGSVMDRTNYCLDWNTGEVKFKTEDLGEGTFIAADDKLFLLTYKGEVAMLKAEDDKFLTLGTFKALGKKPNHFSQPVIHDGILYLRYNEMIKAFNIQK